MLKRILKQAVLGILFPFIAGYVLHRWVGHAEAGTVVSSTTTYNGADEAGFPAGALPEPGAYIFDLVAKSTPLASTPLTGLSVYLQQVGVSGQVYTLNASTFTTCNASCTQLVNPDVYEGGNIRVRWTVTSGSATIKVTARKINP